MQSSEVQIKCAEIFLKRESMHLVYRCFFCNEWFGLHHEFAGHLSACCRSWMGNDLAEPHSLNGETNSEVKIELPNDSEHDGNRSIEADLVDPIQMDTCSVADLKIETEDLSSCDAESSRSPGPKPAATHKRPTTLVKPATFQRLSAQEQNNTFARALIKNIRNARCKKVPLECDLCASQYYTRTDMLNHMRREHANKNLTCHRCGETFLRYSQLRTHMRQYPVDPFTCEFCAASFALKKNLIRHIRVHTGEKPYECKQCGRGFADSNDLKKHEIAIHNGYKRFKCTQCDASFVCRNNLRAHVDFRHRNIPIARPHKCDVCAMGFPRPSQLQQHYRTHTGEKPYACQYCERRFSKPAALKVHENTHTGHSPFTCNHCDRSFHSSAARRSHEKNVHKIGVSRTPYQQLIKKSIQ